MRATITLSCMLIAATSGAALADGSPTVWAKRDTQLHSRPGEASASIGRVEPGERLVVIGSQGRWLRVRHRQRTGWVTRTQVEERGDRAERKRRGATGFSGKQREDALKVTVDIDRVRAFDDPRTKAKETLDLKRGDELVVLGRGHEGWILVESEGAGVGWIPETAVTDGGKFARDPRRAPAETQPDAPAPAAPAEKASVATTTDDAADETEAAPAAAPAPASAAASASADKAVVTTSAAPGRMPKVIIVGGLGLGGEALAMRQSGVADALGTVYGASLNVAAEGHYRIAKTMWVGGGVDASMMTGGMTLETSTESVGSIGANTMSILARAEFTYAPSWRVSGRLGYHYGTLSTDSPREDAMVIGEQVGGPTVGLGGGYPINHRFAVEGALDVAPASTQRPTKLPGGGLYGTSMKEGWATVVGTMKLPWKLTGALQYRGGLASLSLTNGSTTASRSDQSHTITAGVRLAW